MLFRSIAVFAMLKDKDIEGVVVALRDQIDEWLVASLPGPRGAEFARMAQALAATGVTAPVRGFDSVTSAYQSAVGLAGQDDKILVFGSFFTVGAVVRARE